MTTPQPVSGLLFCENVSTEAEGVFIASSVSVSVDYDGYFVTIETDPHEGSAMFTLPAAREVLASLTRAIAAAEAYRENRA